MPNILLTHSIAFDARSDRATATCLSRDLRGGLHHTIVSAAAMPNWSLPQMVRALTRAADNRVEPLT